MLTVLRQTKAKLGFPLEDKHLVSKHHVTRKSRDVTQEKSPHVVLFKIPRDWFETNSRLPKSVTLKAAKKKKIGVSRSTGKSNIAQTKNLSDIT